jgi:hypothetical protein
MNSQMFDIRRHLCSSGIALENGSAPKTMQLYANSAFEVEIFYMSTVARRTSEIVRQYLHLRGAEW